MVFDSGFITCSNEGMCVELKMATKKKVEVEVTGRRSLLKVPKIFQFKIVTILSPTYFYLRMYTGKCKEKLERWRKCTE